MKVRNIARKYGPKLAAVGTALALPVLSFAQTTVEPIDVSAATGGISAAQVAVLAVLGAMIVMSASVYGLRKVLALLGR